ncbi:unnamed protein product, partial [Choristocarpus tenellus]
QVDKVDPSVLRSEVEPLVTAALADHDGDTLTLPSFCSLLDKAIARLAGQGPTTRVFAQPRPIPSPSQSQSEKTEAEERELTFHPQIDSKSVEMAKLLGRGGSKVRPIEDILWREIKRQERHRQSAQRQREQAFRRDCPFTP